MCRLSHSLIFPMHLGARIIAGGLLSKRRRMPSRSRAVVGASSDCVCIKRNGRIAMPRNFYFGKDADIVTGSANFASLIATGFASYGLTTGQATAFGTLDTALQSAHTDAVEPSTRTPVSVEAKNIALRAM